MYRQVKNFLKYLLGSVDMIFNDYRDKVLIGFTDLHIILGLI